MTPEQLAEIRARAEAATPGPWGLGWIEQLRRSPADCDFVAHAPTDIPALLDYIEELQAEINGAHDVLDTFGAPRETYEPQAHELVTWNLGGRVCRYREVILRAVNGVKEPTNA